IEQDFGCRTDFAGAMFLPACIEEMGETENYTDARFSDNDFYLTESEASKKASLAYTDKESEDKYETGVTLIDGFVDLLQNKLRTDASTNTISSKTCAKYPSSTASSSPTGTLTPLEQQNELWQAIGSLDIFLADKDIIEACEKSNEDHYHLGSDNDLLGTPSVSLVEFLQQYKELTDWLKQVKEITHRDIACLSEKYLHLSYHEEMLERSSRRQVLEDYSSQLVMFCPKVADEIKERMAALDVQWVDLEQAVNTSFHLRNPEAMKKDLQKDLTTLKQWLTEVEAALVPLTVNNDWTQAELVEKLQKHQ
ncbi:unnamed protein product, partial [Candidula unifasciata]